MTFLQIQCLTTDLRLPGCPKNRSRIIPPEMIPYNTDGVVGVAEIVKDYLSRHASIGATEPLLIELIDMVGTVLTTYSRDGNPI